MQLAITCRIVSGVSVVDLSGRLCFLDVALSKYFKELLEQGQREFVLNMAEVPYVDSFGLGQLITVWTSIRAKGGHMILLRPTDHLLHLLQITKLDTVFLISGDEVEAIRSVGTHIAISA